MWSKYPLVCLAVPVVVGMCGAHWLMGWVEWRLDMIFVVMCSLLMMSMLTDYAYARAPLFRHVFYTAVFFACLFFGAYLYIIRYRDVSWAVNGQQACLQGVVRSAPQQKSRSVAVELEQEDGVRLMVYLQNDSVHSPQGVQMGDTLIVHPLHLNLTCPTALSDTSAFHDYYSRLFFRGLSATCYVPSGCWTQRPLTERRVSWNEQLHEYFTQSELDSVTSAMAEALTIGRRDGLSRQLRNDYSAAGVAHVLALSGMHLGLIIGLLNAVLFRFILYEQRRWAMLAVIPLLWVFTYVAGMPPSLVRAAVMATMLQLAFALNRPYSLLNALAFAALVILIANPLMLVDVGFQLSFASMLGISVLFRPLMEITTTTDNKSKIAWLLHCRPIRTLISLTLLTVSTTLFTAPLVACYFGQLPVYSLLTNLVVPLLMTCVMAVIFVWLVLSFWPWAQLWVGMLLDEVVRVQNGVVQHIAAWPASTLEWQPTVWMVLLYYVLLAVALWILSKCIYGRINVRMRS